MAVRRDVLERQQSEIAGAFVVRRISCVPFGDWRGSSDTCSKRASSIADKGPVGTGRELVDPGAKCNVSIWLSVVDSPGSTGNLQRNEAVRGVADRVVRPLN